MKVVVPGFSFLYFSHLVDPHGESVFGDKQKGFLLFGFFFFFETESSRGVAQVRFKLATEQRVTLNSHSSRLHLPSTRMTGQVWMTKTGSSDIEIEVDTHICI